MFVKIFLVLFMFTFFIFCDSTFVENLAKCHLDDNECLRNLYQTSIREIGKHGIPEVKIPPVDPIHLTNITVSIPNLGNITMVDGFAKGIKDCIFDKFSINITSGMGHQEITCDITIKGHYRAHSAGALLESLTGGKTISGDGNGKVKIDKLHLKSSFPFYAQRRDDGEIYIKCNYDHIKYEYEIGGPVGFFADNLYIGGEEVSKQLTQLATENWRFVTSIFGQPFIDKAMEISFKFAGYFFDHIPARYYIIEDLSPYAKP